MKSAYFFARACAKMLLVLLLPLLGDAACAQRSLPLPNLRVFKHANFKFIRIPETRFLYQVVEREEGGKPVVSVTTCLSCRPAIEYTFKIEPPANIRLILEHSRFDLGDGILEESWAYASVDFYDVYKSARLVGVALVVSCRFCHRYATYLFARRSAGYELVAQVIEDQGAKPKLAVRKMFVRVAARLPSHSH